MDAPIIRLRETASTNQYLTDNISGQNLPEGSVVVADYQTKGRGQPGNSWESDAGKNLTFSLLLCPEHIPACEVFTVSQMVSLAVRDTINDYYAENVTIKWPNDIYYIDKKVGGILIENTIMGEYVKSSVIGIGLNINQKIFAGNAPNPVSLSMISGKNYDCDEILLHLLNRIYLYYIRTFEGEKDGIHTAYMGGLYRREGFFDYRDADGMFKARIVDVELSGRLVLQLPDCSIRRYAFKEVSYVI